MPLALTHPVDAMNPPARKKTTPARRSRSTPSLGSPAQEPPTVLMVEDDSEFAEDMTVILRGKATLIRARGTAEAAAILMRRPPDLLWLDVNLAPFFGCDGATEGLEFLRAMRQRMTIDFPILIVTADVGSITEAIHREFPKATILTKPPEPSRLFAAVAEILPRLRRP